MCAIANRKLSSSVGFKGICRKVLILIMVGIANFIDLHIIGKGRNFCDSIVKAFCNELEKNGYYAGLYIFRSPLQNYISESIAKRYALWIAEYGGRCNYNGKYGMWQYSSQGRVSGVNGNCDMDIAYVGYPSIIIKKGFNGYKVKSVDEVAREVIQGKWGNGNERKQKLEAAGYNYNKVQKGVNEMLKIK